MHFFLTKECMNFNFVAKYRPYSIGTQIIMLKFVYEYVGSGNLIRKQRWKKSIFAHN